MKALVLGDFVTVIPFFLSTEQYANTILLTMNEGPDSKAYFETFIEKITIFRSVANYVETDHQPQVQADTAEEKSYGLAGLYDRYLEYADLLVTQGLAN